MTTTKTHPMSGVDALSPPEIARLVDERGVAKANASVVTTFVLGVLAAGAARADVVFSDGELAASSFLVAEIEVAEGGSFTTATTSSR